MADPLDPNTTLETVTIEAVPPNTDTIQQFMRQDFLKSSQFIFRLPAIPFKYSGIPLRDFSLFCESIEFPGKSVSAVEYKIPGKNRIKLPYSKEYQDVTTTFIHNTTIPVYDFFASWLTYISGSNTSTENIYFDECTTSFNMIQYSDMPVGKYKKLQGLSSILNTVDVLNKLFFDSSKLFNVTDIGQTFINRINNTQGIPKKSEYYDVEFINAYPISYASLPSTWSDDNYHRLSVTWTYERFKINGYPLTGLG